MEIIFWIIGSFQKLKILEYLSNFAQINIFISKTETNKNRKNKHN